MACTTVDLREKAVINICNGQDMGRVNELEIDVTCGKVTSIIVNPEGFASLFSCRNQVTVPWENIVKIGKDSIIVELQQNTAECETDDKSRCGKVKKWWRLRCAI